LSLIELHVHSKPKVKLNNEQRKNITVQKIIILLVLEKEETCTYTIQKLVTLLVVMVHTCNSSTQEAEAGRTQVQGQPGLHGEALP
jgi:hypothetical protein